MLAGEIAYYVLVPGFLTLWVLIICGLILRMLWYHRDHKEIAIARRHHMSPRATFELRNFGYTGRDQDMRTCTPWRHRVVLQRIAMAFTAYRAFQMMMLPLSSGITWRSTTNDNDRVVDTLSVLQALALDLTSTPAIGAAFGVLYGLLFLHPLIAAFVPRADQAIASVGGFGPDVAALFCEHFYFTIMRLSARLLACHWTEDSGILLDTDSSTTCFDKSHIAAVLFALLPCFTLLPLASWWNSGFRESSGPVLGWHQYNNLATVTVHTLLALATAFVHLHALALAWLFLVGFVILLVAAYYWQPCLYNYGVGRYMNNAMIAVYATCVMTSICAVVAMSRSNTAGNGSLIVVVVVIIPVMIIAAGLNNQRAVQLEYNPANDYYVTECFRIGFGVGADYDSYTLFAEQPRLIIAQSHQTLARIQRLCQLLKSSDEVVNGILDRAHDSGLETETIIQLLYNVRVFRFWGALVHNESRRVQWSDALAATVLPRELADVVVSYVGISAPPRVNHPFIMPVTQNDVPVLAAAYHHHTRSMTMSRIQSMSHSYYNTAGGNTAANEDSGNNSREISRVASSEAKAAAIATPPVTLRYISHSTNGASLPLTILPSLPVSLASASSGGPPLPPSPAPGTPGTPPLPSPLLPLPAIHGTRTSTSHGPSIAYASPPSMLRSVSISQQQPSSSNGTIVVSPDSLPPLPASSVSLPPLTHTSSVSVSFSVAPSSPSGSDPPSPIPQPATITPHAQSPPSPRLVPAVTSSSSILLPRTQPHHFHHSLHLDGTGSRRGSVSVRFDDIVVQMAPPSLSPIAPMADISEHKRGSVASAESKMSEEALYARAKHWQTATERWMNTAALPVWDGLLPTGDADQGLTDADRERTLNERWISLETDDLAHHVAQHDGTAHTAETPNVVHTPRFPRRRDRADSPRSRHASLYGDGIMTQATATSGHNIAIHEDGELAYMTRSQRASLDMRDGESQVSRVAMSSISFGGASRLQSNDEHEWLTTPLPQQVTLRLYGTTRAITVAPRFDTRNLVRPYLDAGRKPYGYNVECGYPIPSR